MAQSHKATIHWSGDASMGTVFLAAASRPGCKAKLSEQDGEAKLEVTVIAEDLQHLRDVVDELMIALADIEESNQS